MRKSFLSLAFLLFSYWSFAQPGTIFLKDGTGSTLSTHATVQSAYDAIPSAMTHPYVIEIDTGYTNLSEVYPITFTNRTGANATNTITIKLSANVEIAYMQVQNDVSAFIFDNADWITIDGTSGIGQNSNSGLHVINSFNAPENFLVQFVNGSSNNRIKNCFFPLMFNTTLTNGGTILFGGTAFNDNGNSDNTIEQCLFAQSALSICSQGDPAKPNKNLKFIGNTFVVVYENVIWIKEGTGNVLIDSNNISVGGLDSFANGILVDDLSDTIIIKNNQIALSEPHNDVPERGIHIRSTVGNSSFCSIVNNFVSTYEFMDLNTGTPLIEQSTDVKGIVLSGNGVMHADVFFNTVRILNTLEDGGAQVVSTAFEKTNNNPLSVMTVKNNLFLNKRSGGDVGVQHVAAFIQNTTGILNMSHNTYNSITGQLVHYNGTLYSNVANYQSAIGGGNEAYSNAANVEFTSMLDFHLYGTSINNIGLNGVMIAGITTDIEGDVRVIPHRGADEFIVSCTGIPQTGTLSSNFSCNYLGINYAPEIVNGKTFQLESRPAGSTAPFIAIPGATSLTYVAPLNQSMEYRMMDYCIAGGAPGISDTITVIYQGIANAIAINETHTALTYQFTPDVLNADYYIWNFGDGSPAVNTPNPTHTYGANDIYMVTLVIGNGCSDDTVTLEINTETTVNVEGISIAKDNIELFPNPAVREVTIQSVNTIDYIELYDIRGVRVLRATVGNAGKHSLDVSTLVNGVYIVQVMSNGQLTRRSLSVKN